MLDNYITAAKYSLHHNEEGVAEALHQLSFRTITEAARRILFITTKRELLLQIQNRKIEYFRRNYCTLISVNPIAEPFTLQFYI